MRLIAFAILLRLGVLFFVDCLAFVLTIRSVSKVCLRIFIRSVSKDLFKVSFLYFSCIIINEFLNLPPKKSLKSHVPSVSVHVDVRVRL